MKEVLDDNGRFLIGKHKGQDVHDVAQENPSYLQWALNNIEMSDEDEKAIQVALCWRDRR